MLERLPDGVAKDLRLKIATMRTILLEQRPPAFALIGRRGSGKSSLINALFGDKVAAVGHVKSQTGQGKWFDFTTKTGTLAILDTRGIQEGSTPAEADDARTPIESIVLELKKKAPDALLFLVKASEVDAAIDADLDALERISDELERMHGLRPPIFGVATHCDLLEPKATRLHAQAEEPKADVDEKLQHVTHVELALSSKLEARDTLRPHVVSVMGVSTYLSFRPDGTQRSDERWRIDALAAALFKHLPTEGRGMFVRLAGIQSLQEELATSLAKATATVCAGIAAVPIPVADMIPITALQVSMIAGIAWISGRTLDTKVAAEFLTTTGLNVGMGYALREGARAIIKYVFPLGGSAVSGIVAFAGTLAIGRAARAYYIRGERGTTTKRKIKRAFFGARGGWSGT